MAPVFADWLSGLGQMRRHRSAEGPRNLPRTVSFHRGILCSLRGDGGAFSLFAAFSMFVLIAFVGLAVDVGRWFVVHNELQSASDSCALAGVYELNGAPDSVVRATSAGSYFAQSNRFDMQDRAVAIAAGDITFSATLNGTYQPAASSTAATARYMRCKVKSSGLVNYLLGVVGLSSVSLGASATAGAVASQTTCTLPMALRGTIGAVNFGFTAGQLFTMPSGFMWSDTQAATDSGAVDVYRQQFVQYGACNVPTPAGRCVGTRDTSDPKTLIDEWNSRFGVYKSSGSYSPTTAVPDLTGYGFTTGGSLSSYLTYHMPNRTPYAGTVPSYYIPAAVHTTYGAPYRRMAIMVVVDNSSVSCGSNSKPVIGWACVLLSSPITASQEAKVEFLTAANDPNTPCRAAGVPGGTGAIGPLVPALMQ